MSILHCDRILVFKFVKAILNQIVELKELDLFDRFIISDFVGIELEHKSIPIDEIDYRMYSNRARFFELWILTFWGMLMCWINYYTHKNPAKSLLVRRERTFNILILHASKEKEIMETYDDKKMSFHVDIWFIDY